jgi:hypothetical protein
LSQAILDLVLPGINGEELWPKLKNETLEDYCLNLTGGNDHA